MKRFLSAVWKFLYLTGIPVLLSGIVRALAIYIFVTPNDFAPGGINGIAILLEYAIHWNSGWFLLMLNVPLFFVAFFFIGKREAIVSFASMLVTSFLLIAFEYIPNFPVYQTETNAFLAAIAGGILLGVALAIMLKSFGTAGGTAVLATVANKKIKFIKVSWFTFLFDAAVVVASFFVFHQGASFTVKLDPVLLALVSLFVTSKVCDIVLEGFKVAYKFEIVTTHPEEISEEIFRSLNHGVTMMPAVGMYSHREKNMLVCVVRKRQVAEVQRILRKYPDTFAYFSSTAEVMGKFIK
ncbi:MAG: YitT family protein [Clostridia bacterium]|nr:YitT family protein [Clostridia bacterium]